MTRTISVSWHRRQNSLRIAILGMGAGYYPFTYTVEEALRDYATEKGWEYKSLRGIGHNPNEGYGTFRYRRTP